MNFVITTIGGGEFLYDILNGIIITINSPAYKSIIHGTLIIGLLFHIFKTSISGSYIEGIKWGFMCYVVFMMAIVPKATVVIEDSTNNSIPRIINNVPIGLAFPASFISNLDTTLAEMFDTNFSPVGDIAYTNSGMLFGNSIIDAMTKTSLTSDVENNFKEFIRQCVYDQVILGNIAKEKIKNSSNLEDVILNQNYHSNIFHVSYILNNGVSDLISCKEASRRIKTDLENSINKVALKTAQMLNPSIYESNSNVALNKTDSQILDVNNYLLKSSKSSLETIKQAVMMQGFIDGMNNRMSLGNSNNPYAVAKAKLTQRESWKVIGANAPTYLVILKIFIQVMLYALFPIIIVMVMAGIFGFSILIEYFKSLFALCLISPCLAILNRISYGYTSYKMKALISTSASNSADYGINLGNIIQIQDFNADIMAFAGYLSIAIVPLCFSITQRGFNSIGSSIGSLMQSSAISNTSSSVMEAVSGNYNLGNTSIGNDSLFNSSKFNINEGNRSVDNDSIGNKSLGNFSKDNISEGNKSFNNDSFNNKSFNNVNANKVDTASSIVRGGTETITERGIGTLTFGSDGKLSSIIQERKTSLENSVSKSEGVSSSEGERVDKGYSGGASIGLSAGSGGGNGGNKIEFKNKILDKVADVVGISGSLNGGMHYNNNSSSETVSSNGTQLTNDQAFAKETIDYLNKKYDNKYMKDNMDVVFKDANEFQASLMKAEKIKSPNNESNSNISNELDQFEKSLKSKK